jgi:hypothetical protein
MCKQCFWYSIFLELKEDSDENVRYGQLIAMLPVSSDVLSLSTDKLISNFESQLPADFDKDGEEDSDGERDAVI